MFRASNWQRPCSRVESFLSNSGHYHKIKKVGSEIEFSLGDYRMVGTVLVTLSRSGYFLWRLADGERIVASGRETSEAQAAIAGQTAQIRFNRERSWHYSPRQRSRVLQTCSRQPVTTTAKSRRLLLSFGVRSDSGTLGVEVFAVTSIYEAARRLEKGPSNAKCSSSATPFNAQRRT